MFLTPTAAAVYSMKHLYFFLQVTLAGGSNSATAMLDLEGIEINITMAT